MATEVGEDGGCVEVLSEIGVMESKYPLVRGFGARTITPYSTIDCSSKGVVEG